MPISVRDVSEQLTWHWTAQIRPRFEGLDDREFFWEPTPNAWSVRAQDDGTFAPDSEWPAAERAPVTTIAWRLCHIWMTLAQRADFHFGRRQLTADRLLWPKNSEQALAAIDDAYASWTSGVAALSDADADRPSERPPVT